MFGSCREGWAGVLHHAPQYSAEKNRYKNLIRQQPIFWLAFRRGEISCDNFSFPSQFSVAKSALSGEKTQAECPPEVECDDGTFFCACIFARHRG